MANKSRLTANIVSNTGISTFSTRLDISNGPVLIGTASSTGTASQPLQVTGGAYVSGNFGIGTTNPGNKLHFSTSSGTNRIQIDSGSDSSFIGYDGSTNDLQLASNNNIKFQTSGSYIERVRITSSGSVGIATTNPQSKLHVVGTVNYTDQLRGGAGSFTKTLGQGDIALDRDLYDTPGILFYYDNNHNYGIDSSQAENTGGTGGHLRNVGDTQMIRFIYRLNESGGFTVAGINSESLAARDYVGFSTLGATMHVRKINDGPIGRHNFFYNSSFAIDLRHDVGPTPATAVGAALTYTVDRWYLYPAGANVTFQRQNTDIIGDTNNYSFDVNGAAGVTYIDFAQRLESVDTSILGGNNVTVSAYVKNTAGITTMRIDLAYANSTNNFSAETYIGQKTVSMSGTTSRISATFENISSFVNRGMSVRFRVYGLTSGVFSIACPQLEIGKVASDWSTVDAATEVNRCARYCQRDGFGVRVANGNWGGSTNAYITRNAYTQFRATPSIHWYLPGKCLVESVAWYNVGAVTLVESSRASQTFNLTGISPSGQAANANATWGNGADVILSAEL